MKILDWIKNLTTRTNKINTSFNAEGFAYGHEWTSKMNVPNHEVIKIPNEIVSVTITPNCFIGLMDFIFDHTDAFCTTLSNSIAKDLFFYNNMESDFIRYRADDLWAGNYVEAAELSAAQFEIDFNHEKGTEYDEIKIALGLYSLHTKKNQVDFSSNCVKNFIVCIRIQGNEKFYLVENINTSKSAFVTLLKFKKSNGNWNLEFCSEEFKSVEDYVSLNFRENGNGLATNSV